MDPIVRAALRERQNLLEELNRNPQFRRLQAVNEIIRVYGDEKQPAPVAAAEPSRPSAATPSPAPPSPQQPAAKGRRRGEKSTLIVTTAATYLRTKGRRAPSGELVKVLTDQGIEIGGKKPSARLAAYLSGDSLFDNATDARGSGYGLAEWSKDPPKAVGLLSGLTGTRFLNG